MNFFRTAVALAALFLSGTAFAQVSPVTNHAFAIGRGSGVSGYTSLLCGAGQLAVAQAGADPICRTVSGDWTLNAAGVSTLATVNANVGAFGSATQCANVTVNAKGLTTAASQVTCTPAVGSVTGLGTGVAAALGVNVGTAGALVVNGGALGTPASGTATNLTALNATQLTTGTMPAARLPLTNATLLGTVTSTTGTTSATQVMMGLGATCTITPVYSSRVHLTISGDMLAASAVLGSLTVMYGTGTAPANGAASTGTVIGTVLASVPDAVATQLPFSRTVIITGLTPATAYWLDMKLSSNNGVSVSIGNVNCAGFEF